MTESSSPNATHCELTQEDVLTRRTWYMAKLSNNPFALAEERAYWLSEVGICNLALRAFASSATVGEEEIKRLRVGDILFSDEQAKMFCDLAMKGLRAEAQRTVNPDMLAALRDYSQQDPDGLFVGVSRQALDEAIEILSLPTSAPVPSDVPPHVPATREEVRADFHSRNDKNCEWFTRDEIEGIRAHLKTYFPNQSVERSSFNKICDLAVKALKPPTLAPSATTSGPFVTELERKVSAHLQGDHHFLHGLLKEIKP